MGDMWSVGIEGQGGRGRLQDVLEIQKQMFLQMKHK